VTLRAAAIVGATGAVTTNVLHEIIRRVAANAPHVDLLGMQALARAVDAAGATPPRRHAAMRPRGRSLYALTLAGDLLSNGAYYALIVPV